MGISYNKILNSFLLLLVFLYAFSCPFAKKISMIEIGILLALFVFLANSLKYLFYKYKEMYYMSILLAIINVFIVNIFLESAYKTFDFGIILLLFFILYNYYKRKQEYAIS